MRLRIAFLRIWQLLHPRFTFLKNVNSCLWNGPKLILKLFGTRSVWFKMSLHSNGNSARKFIGAYSVCVCASCSWTFAYIFSRLHLNQLCDNIFALHLQTIYSIFLRFSPTISNENSEEFDALFSFVCLKMFQIFGNRKLLLSSPRRWRWDYIHFQMTI